MILTEITKDSSRITPVPGDWVDFAAQHCSDALRSSVLLQRGTGTLYKQPVVLHPGAAELRRESETNSQFLLRWIDNDPRWQEYPDRGRSAFFTTGRAEFGRHEYIVLPLNGSKLASCPGDDINLTGAFPYTRIKHDIDDDMLTETLTDKFEELRELLNDTKGINVKNIPRHDFTYKDIVTMLNLLTAGIKSGAITRKNVDSYISGNDELFSHMIKSNDCYAFLQDALDPKNNNYKLIHPAQLNALDDEHTHEVWTSDKVLLIHKDLWDGRKDELGRR